MSPVCRTHINGCTKSARAKPGTSRPARQLMPERIELPSDTTLVGRPAIVLADEPTGNLDSATGASIMELIRELNAAGATIIMITHDTGLADALPRQIRLLDGVVVSDTVCDRGMAPVVDTQGTGELR